MIAPTQPLKDEHSELLPHVETLLRVADSVGTASTQTLLESTGEAYEFLAHHLIPHAHAEDQVLYPFIEKVTSAPSATATMSRDHVEVGRLTEQLGSLRSRLAMEPLNAYLANELRRVLYGLYALVKLHFAKEEEVYLPMLDARCTPEEMQPVFANMEEAANQAKKTPVA